MFIWLAFCGVRAYLTHHFDWLLRVRQPCHVMIYGVLGVCAARCGMVS